MSLESTVQSPGSYRLLTVSLGVMVKKKLTQVVQRDGLNGSDDDRKNINFVKTLGLILTKLEVQYYKTHGSRIYIHALHSLCRLPTHT